MSTVQSSKLASFALCAPYADDKVPELTKKATLEFYGLSLGKGATNHGHSANVLQTHIIDNCKPVRQTLISGLANTTRDGNYPGGASKLKEVIQEHD